MTTERIGHPDGRGGVCTCCEPQNHEPSERQHRTAQDRAPQRFLACVLERDAEAEA